MFIKRHQRDFWQRDCIFRIMHNAQVVLKLIKSINCLEFDTHNLTLSQDFRNYLKIKFEGLQNWKKAGRKELRKTNNSPAARLILNKNGDESGAAGVAQLKTPCRAPSRCHEINFLMYASLCHVSCVAWKDRLNTINVGVGVTGVVCGQRRVEGGRK